MMLYWIHKINVNYLKQKRLLDSENKTFNCFCLWPSRPMTDFLNRSTRLCGRSAALYSRFTLIIVDTESIACLGHWGVCFYSFCKINTRPSRYLYRLMLPSSSQSGSPLFEILDRHDTFYVTILGGVCRCLTLPENLHWNLHRGTQNWR